MMENNGMSDIVERLRNRALAAAIIKDKPDLYNDAADAIIRLCERLAEADEANRRVSGENEKLRENNDYLRSEKERLGKDVYNLIVKKDEACAEIETLRRDVKTAVMGDSAELQDVKRENEKLREALRPLAKAYEEFMRVNDCTEYEIANDPYLHTAAAAIRETDAP